jgi:hypothetical protein
MRANPQRKRSQRFQLGARKILMRRNGTRGRIAPQRDNVANALVSSGSQNGAQFFLGIGRVNHVGARQVQIGQSGSIGIGGSTIGLRNVRGELHAECTGTATGAPSHVGKDGSNALVQARHARLQILPVYMYILYTHKHRICVCVCATFR